MKKNISSLCANSSNFEKVKTCKGNEKNQYEFLETNQHEAGNTNKDTTLATLGSCPLYDNGAPRRQTKRGRGVEKYCREFSFIIRIRIEIHTRPTFFRSLSLPTYREPHKSQPLTGTQGTVFWKRSSWHGWICGVIHYRGLRQHNCVEKKNWQIQPSLNFRKDD